MATNGGNFRTPCTIAFLPEDDISTLKPGRSYAYHRMLIRLFSLYTYIYTYIAYIYTYVHTIAYIYTYVHTDLLVYIHT